MQDFFSGHSKAGGWLSGVEQAAAEVMAHSHFRALAGLELDYYGADEGDSTFKVDGIVFKILEDPNDGYRSMLGAIDYTDQHASIFFGSALARVRIEVYDGDDADGYGMNQGYALVDIADGHVWLEFGTDNYDDYYPMFVFRHYPKKNFVV